MQEDVNFFNRYAKPEDCQLMLAYRWLWLAVGSLTKWPLNLSITLDNMEPGLAAPETLGERSRIPHPGLIYAANPTINQSPTCGWEVY